MRAKAEGISNFFCFCNHVTIVPPLRALLESPDLRLDGFIGPGHVSTVVGARPFEFIPADYGKPIVISGFEPLDLLQSVYMMLRQLAEGRCEVENQYRRVVPYDGNPSALQVLAEVFELRPHFEWRGLGFISHSALKLSDAYARLRRGASLRGPGRARRRPEGLPVRRGAQGRDQAVGVQGLRHRVHARAADRNLHGLVGRAPAPPTTTSGASPVSARWCDRVGDRRTGAARAGHDRAGAREAARGSGTPQITMAHGAGGKATQTLVEGLFVPAFGSEALRELDDAGVGRRRSP